MASPVIAKLFERKEAIAKLPLVQQQKLWNFVYSQEVRPKIEQVRASGGQVEDDTVARERFVTSMTGGEQKPTAEPNLRDVSQHQRIYEGLVSVAPEVAGLIAGTAGGLKHVVENFPDPLKWEGAPLGTKTLSKVEGMYDVAKEKAARNPVLAAGTEFFTGLGHQVPNMLAYETGTSIVPTIESSVAKVPALIKGANYVARILTGSGAMALAGGGDVSEHFVRDAGTIAIFDAFLHGIPFIGKSGVKAAGNVKTWFSTKGVAPSKDGLMQLSDEVKQVIGEMFPDKLEAIKNGAPAVRSPRTPEGALTVEEMTTALNTAQQRAVEAEAATRHANRVEKIALGRAEKESAKLSKIAEAEIAKANQAAKALKLKAFQRELSAYRKLTGQVPLQGSESWNALLGGAKAAELVPAQQAVATAKAAGVSEAKAVRDVVAEQPKVADVVQALGGMAETSVTPKVSTKPPVPTEQATASASTPEVRSPEQVTSPAAQVKVTAPKSPALTTFGIKVDTSTWKTPEDVVKGKADLTEQLKASAIKQANTIKDAFATKQITKAQADALNAQLSNELLKAAGSINKVKVPEVSRAARDRVRKAAQVGAVQATAKAEQKLAEQTGRAVGSTVPSEEDAFLKIDELVKKGFRLIGQEPKAKEIMLAADKEGLDNASKLELLQDAFNELTKRK